MRVHLDGARLLNASVALHVPPAHIMEHCDSVSLCFSKVGSHWATPQTQEGGGACSRRWSWVPQLLGWQLLSLSPVNPSPDWATASALPHPLHAPSPGP